MVLEFIEGDEEEARGLECQALQILVNSLLDTGQLDEAEPYLLRYKAKLSPSFCNSDLNPKP